MRRLLCPFLVLSAVAVGQARSPIAGRVVTAADLPVAGALVSCGGGGVTSDADGRFAFDGSDECVLSVRKRGFAHARVTVINGGTHLVVRLTPSEVLWTVPRCGSSETPRWGFNLQVALPATGKVRRGKDANYAAQSWTARKDGAAIAALSGPLVSAGLPDQLHHDEDARLVLRERLWQTAGATDTDPLGLDVAGRDDRGLYWRYVGRFAGEVIAYRDASAAEAAVFDQMIDGMCDAQAPAPPRP